MKDLIELLNEVGISESQIRQSIYIQYCSRIHYFGDQRQKQRLTDLVASFLKRMEKREANNNNL